MIKSVNAYLLQQISQHSIEISYHSTKSYTIHVAMKFHTIALDSQLS